jgi:hypothetical protein
MRKLENGTLTWGTIVTIILALLGAGIFQVTVNARHQAQLEALTALNVKRDGWEQRMEAKLDKALEMLYTRTSDGAKK